MTDQQDTRPRLTPEQFHPSLVRLLCRIRSVLSVDPVMVDNWAKQRAHSLIDDFQCSGRPPSDFRMYLREEFLDWWDRQPRRAAS